MATKQAATEDDMVSATWTERDRLASMSTINNPGPYVVGSYLGCGGWSEVHKVLRKSDKKVFAGKTSRCREQLRKEIEAMRSFKHQHILTYVDLYEVKDDLAATLLITELCPHGNLQKLIDLGSSGMSRTSILQVTVQITGALEFLHLQGRYHSDVKPRNILIRRAAPVIDVVLADMADLKRVGDGGNGNGNGNGKKAPVFRGTPLFASPEAARSSRHCGPADDMWALGISLLAMMEQSPRVTCTKQGLKEYPRTCFEHVRQLRAMNPAHDLVGLLAELTAWEVGERLSAASCLAKARELLEMGPQEDDDCGRSYAFGTRLGIKAPAGFQAISFW